MTAAVRPDYATRTKFHMSLSVSDLGRSIEFYKALFGLEPAKRFADYAKFELEDPPVIFSIIPHPPNASGGVMSHAGFKVADHAAVETTRQRLESAGYPVQCQTGAVCGYRKQDKVHVADPDGTHWEVYVVEEELAPETVRRGVEGSAAHVEPPSATTVWEHFVTNPMPDRIPHADGTVEEVRLVGTFNANLTDEQQRFLVHEARRVLKPGGQVMVHGLMADRAFPGQQPTLPGLAAMVSRVPVQTTPMDVLRDAGFVGLHITRFSEQPWFRHDGVELREVKLIAWQPGAPGGRRRVLYKGPFAEIADEAGTVYPRGRRVEVSDATWELLRRGAAAEQFLFLDPNAAPTSCAV